MKTWRVCSGFCLAMVSVGLVQAQPERALREAADQLFAAGNYSWRESRQSVFNARSSVTPYGLGRTIITGFTLATIIEPKNLRAAFYGPRTAFETKEGWRRTIDFTDDEIAEVFGLPPTMLVELPRMAELQRKYTHALFHDILRVLLQTGANIHAEDDAIVGSVMSRELEMFISSGRQPVIMDGRILPSLLGNRPLPGVKEEGGVFHAWLSDGKISKCVLDFTRAGVVTRGEHAGASYTNQRVYTYDIMDIGTTEVDVTPDIAAVFNDVAIKR